MLDLQNCCSKEHLSIVPYGASFYSLLVSFRPQITYRKVRNSRIGVNKLLGKVSINCVSVLLTQFIDTFIDTIYQHKQM